MNNNQKIKKKTVLIISLIIIACILIIIGSLWHIISLSNDNKKDKVTEIGNQLWYDYNNGLITTDEYIKYNLYNLYDNSLLNDKYISSTQVRIDDLITKHYNDISEETLKLYIDYYSLSNLSFKSEEPKIKPMTNNTTTNLNKAYLSSKGNFIIWYTTDGDSAIEYSKVQKYAELLEDTISQYNNIFNVDYSLKTTVISKKGDRYKEQIKILNSNSIDEKYFVDAMHIYIYDLNSSTIPGSYNSINISNDGFSKFMNDYFYESSEKDGTIITPYMILNSTFINDNNSNFDDVIAHEMVHHYQNYIINNTDGNRKAVTDTIIGEATAQWGAAKIAKNDSKNNNLNTWVSNYLLHTNDILTEMYNTHGGEVGYALGNFLYSYENNVSDGTTKILKAIHCDNGIKCLNNSTTNEERDNTMKYLALKNLNNDYPSNNYLATSSSSLRLKKEITKNNYSSKQTPLSNIGIDYYSFSHNYNYEITAAALDNNTIDAYLVELKDNNYRIIESYLNTRKEITIITDEYYNYDKLYLIIINSDFENAINYRINVNQTAEKTIKNNINIKTDFNNYRIKATSNMKIYGMETVMNMNGIIDELHQKEYIKVNSNVLGMNIDIETYVDFYNGYTYTSNPITGKWEKTEGGTSIIDLSLIVDKFKETGNVTKITEEHYLVKLDNDDIKGLLKYNSSLNEFKITGEITVNVYIKDNYVQKLEYDFSKIIEEIEEFSMSIEFYDHNKAGDVLIPVKVEDKDTTTNNDNSSSNTDIKDEENDIEDNEQVIGDSIRFNADSHFLTKAEGGLHTPFFPGRAFKFKFDNETLYDGTVKFPNGVEMVSPGDDIALTITLSTKDSLNIKTGTKFTIYDKDQIIGNGTVK